MNVDFDTVKAEATGRWTGIFSELGIDVGEGNHQACPLCGGKDRFRYDNKDGKGTYICGQCGAGDGWVLVQKVLGCDFAEAVKQVKPIIGIVDKTEYVPKKTISPEILRDIFKGSKKASKANGVGKYLKGRGLEIVPTKLRFHPGMKEPDSGNTYPAMLGIVSMPDGEAVTIHRTFLNPETWGKAPVDKPKKLMPGLKKISGGAIRIFPQTEAGMVGIAEGIETAIACMQSLKIPTWAAVSSSMMEAFEPPVDIKTVCIFGDNDKNFTGQKAAYKLANRLVVKRNLTVEVNIPDEVGDFLDEMMR